MTTILELEQKLKEARAAGAFDDTPVVVGDRTNFEHINDLKIALHEPRDITGRRTTSLRMIFLS